MVMPGLIDAHNHPIAGGLQLLECDLHYAPLTIAQFQQTIQGCLDETQAKGPDSYLTVVGWYDRRCNLPARRSPRPTSTTKDERPILVRSTDGHTTLGNSRAHGTSQDHA